MEVFAYEDSMGPVSNSFESDQCFAAWVTGGGLPVRAGDWDVSILGVQRKTPRTTDEGLYNRGKAENPFHRPDVARERLQQLVLNADIIGTQPDDELNAWEEEGAVINGKTAQQVKGCRQEVTRKDGMVYGQGVAREEWSLKRCEKRNG